MRKEIRILDKKFELLIKPEKIRKIVEKISKQINKDFKGEEIIFIPVLNGAFIFAADLLRNVKIRSRVTFLKLQSYSGDKSTGNVKKLIGLTEDIKGKKVIVIEDIVDTGETLIKLLDLLKEHNPLEIKIATLLFKKDNYRKSQKIDYIGFEIPSRFVIGYGLDYSGYGRNLNGIYIEKS